MNIKRKQLFAIKNAIYSQLKTDYKSKLTYKNKCGGKKCNELGVDKDSNFTSNLDILEIRLGEVKAIELYADGLGYIAKQQENKDQETILDVEDIEGMPKQLLVEALKKVELDKLESLIYRFKYVKMRCEEESLNISIKELDYSYKESEGLELVQLAKNNKDFNKEVGELEQKFNKAYQKKLERIIDSYKAI